MDHPEQELTAADRRAIAEIRRKIDAEFREKLDAEFGPLEEPSKNTGRRPRTRHRTMVAAFMIGMLAGTAALGGIVWWGHYAGREKRQASPPTRATVVAPGSDHPAAPSVAAQDVASLRDAVDEWIDATRRGDIAAQMRFYPARVPVYYTWRNVPRNAVHDEKVKVFGAASRLVITTGTPAVEVAHDGLTAITRFRKRYDIEGPVIRRRGEVLQELRWTRTDGGWLIVGERDARVLRSG